MSGAAALTGAAAARGGRIVAECAGPSGTDPGGGLVRLRMWVNEKLVAEASDASDPLGPGAAGVQVAPDAGEALRVRFESFAIDRTKD
ncbi:hypothetical protein [Nonomuraea sp. NPDC048901]|uniref:hypothetical protein n=1 Tax=Nonomuraea sp. NPDC048901 TaxID=3155627 RepID=UPI003405F6B3